MVAFTKPKQRRKKEKSEWLATKRQQSIHCWQVPCASRNSFEPLASHICTPLSASSLALVEPLINHRSSSATPLQKTLFVVNRGKFSLKLNLICVPKTEMVPVPEKQQTRFVDKRQETRFVDNRQQTMDMISWISKYNNIGINQSKQSVSSLVGKPAKHQAMNGSMKPSIAIDN